jgi:histidine ammonia-lyase
MPKAAKLDSSRQSSHTNGRRVITLGGKEHMTLAEVVAVGDLGARVSLSHMAEQRVQAARTFVDRICEENRTVYGVTTGFGHLSSVKIPSPQLAELQRNLIRSHSSGVGEPFDVATTRAVMVLLANSLARGYSGIRLEVVRLLIAMLNHGVTPLIPMAQVVTWRPSLISVSSL